MDASAIVFSAVAGAAIGSAATLAWESFARPRIVGRSLAELLLNDLSLHLQAVTMELAQRTERPQTVPLSRPMQTQVYSSVIGRVAELPMPLVGGVVATYRVIERLNDIAAMAQDAFKRYREHIGTPGEADDEHDLARALALYESFLRDAIRRISLVQPQLHAAAFPRWSLRRRHAPGLTTTDGEPFAARIRDLEETVKRNADEIKRRRPSS